MGLFGKTGNCALCGKPIGLNCYVIGKTASGKVLSKCPECAKKGGYLKIVGEKAMFCDKDGNLLETPDYNKEFRVKCDTCGHIYCYTQADLDENQRLMQQVVRERSMAVSNALFGSQLTMHANTNRADNLESKVVDYNKCPHCNSTNIRKLTDKEWEIERNRKTGGTSVASVADEIKKFKELLDMGVITQEEFDTKKKQLLGL